MKVKIFWVIIFVALFSSLSVIAQNRPAPLSQEQIPCSVIRKINYPVTQRNPSAQPLRIALLNLCPEKPGEVARPMLSLMIDGKTIWREYEVVKVFKNEKEARKYAKKNKITDVNF